MAQMEFTFDYPLGLIRSPMAGGAADIIANTNSPLPSSNSIIDTRQLFVFLRDETRRRHARQSQGTVSQWGRS